MRNRENAADRVVVDEKDRTVLAAVPISQLVFGLSQGVQPAVLCQTAEVPALELVDRDKFVPHVWKTRLWDALRVHCPNIPVGIAFGKFFTADHLGFVGQVFRNARDGLDALNKLARFAALFDSHAIAYASPIEVDERQIRLTASRHLMGTLECLEACMFGFITQLNALTGTKARVLEVRVHLEDQRHRAEYEAFFECPVRFGYEHSGMDIARESLSVPLQGANVEAVAQIEAYVSESLASTSEQAFLAKVQGVMQSQLRGGTVGQSDVARALGTSVRALQRRLAKQGTTFAQLVEDLRRTSALRMLRETDAAVYEIAFCLGYQDVSSFGRAFKRWVDASPRSYRLQSRGK
jgi:AraC-like DNA-binding protein